MYEVGTGKTGAAAAEEKAFCREQLVKPNIGKVIEQVTVIESLNIVIAIVDGLIRVLDLLTLTPRAKLDSTKECYMFCTNRHQLTSSSSSPALSLCVALRRKLLFFRWEGNGFRAVSEVPMLSSVKAAEFVSKNSCMVGTSKDYVVIQIDSSTVTEMFPVGKRGKPIIALLPDDEVLLAKDNQGIFVSADGRPTRDEASSIVFADAPLDVVYSHPYIISMLNASVEVRNLTTRTLIQTVDCKSGKSMTCRPGRIYLLTANAVVLLQQTSLAKQVQDLVAHNAFPEAIALASLSNPTDPTWEERRTERLNDVYLRYGYFLFNQGKFDDAMRYFQQAKCSPRQILALFSDVLPKDQCRGIQHPVKVKRIVEDDLLRVRVPQRAISVASFADRDCVV